LLRPSLSREISSHTFSSLKWIGRKIFCLDSSRLQTIKKKVEFTPFFLVHAFLTAKNKMADVDQDYTCQLEN